MLGSGEAGYGGGALPEAVAWREAGVAGTPVVVGQVLIPAAEVAARGEKAAHGAKGLKQGVVVEGSEDGLGGLLFHERDATK